MVSFHALRNGDHYAKEKNQTHTGVCSGSYHDDERHALRYALLRSRRYTVGDRFSAVAEECPQGPEE